MKINTQPGKTQPHAAPQSAFQADDRRQFAGHLQHIKQMADGSPRVKQLLTLANRAEHKQKDNRNVSQLRRLPEVGQGNKHSLENLLIDEEGDEVVDHSHFKSSNYEAHKNGLLRLIDVAKQSVSADTLNKIELNSKSGLTDKEWAELPEAKQLLKYIAAFNSVVPEIKLGDPGKIRKQPAPNSGEKFSIHALINSADNLVSKCITDIYDPCLKLVFGDGNVDVAKEKYRNGIRVLKELFSAGKIVVDESGYHSEIMALGIASNEEIILTPEVAYQPNEKNSILTVIHESMHAGNYGDVIDIAYYNESIFYSVEHGARLRNAAHYEILPMYLLGLFGRQQFSQFTTPQTSHSPQESVASQEYPVIDAKSNNREFSDIPQRAVSALRCVWAKSINIHRLLVNLYNDPNIWIKDQDKSKLILYWSEAEGLTIHKKTQLISTLTSSSEPQPKASILPVSQIDLALSEGVGRQLAVLVSWVDVFAKCNTFPGNLDIASKNKLLRQILLEGLHAVGSVTGDYDQDLNLINRLLKDPSSAKID